VHVEHAPRLELSPLPRLVEKAVKCKPLGRGASVLEESQHFEHWLGNKRMILNLQAELRARARAERHDAARAFAALRAGAKEPGFQPWPFGKDRR
jgi:hypothetical protein